VAAQDNTDLANQDSQQWQTEAVAAVELPHIKKQAAAEAAAWLL
jgi:hypothetical protein